ncbi:PhoX family protein [Marinobacter vinifirmus]|uniref:PhoX family phosphatase n=1 Tax=Marinobacter vinifirmus TaxID=355591 RepID=A0A558BCG1_9GAMM|nr:PhoX family phosphatase [Marinobacter vinifirmus]TVT34187.1 MAG: PhoX family phosphatase [Marinobacter vinifirmus]
MAKHDIDPNYLDPNYEPVVNHSENLPFHQVLSARMQRRAVMKGTVGAALASVMGLGLVACGGDSDSDEDTTSGNTQTPGTTERTLGFQAIPVSTANEVVVPSGYSAEAFLPWGTPITGSYPDYRPDGTNTGADQEQQVGMHHDGMHFFPLDQKSGGSSSEEGLLVMNHEYINQSAIHPNGATVNTDGSRPADEVRKEIAAHGVSVVHIKRDSNGVWDVVQSAYNRRVTGGTAMDIRGPLRGYEKLVTPYSLDATATRGTLNNCSMGPTPWGTYLTAEENWHGYFAFDTDVAERPREYARHGVGGSSRYDWEKADSGLDQYRRFDVTPTVDGSATTDYRNEANTFGYMVEIDPFSPESKPQKRTALGRFGHEGVIFAPAKEGEPVVCYSGDDSRFEYIYKFVSSKPYYAATAGGYLLDEGTLYVARFNEDGSGEWLALDLDNPAFASKVNAAKGTTVGDVAFDGFENQADVLLNTRLAADIAGATPMDRPEWGAVDPNTGEVYFTLTNNTKRTEDQVNASNPVAQNKNGHIIRWQEAGNDYTADSFDWDIFVFAGEQGTETVVDGDAVVTLNDDNIFNSPDGLWFDYNGRLWIQTDGYSDETFGNQMMLAANPETREIKRFFVGPQGCEVTGVVTTPDSKTMFVNIQHPRGNWPNAAEDRPRDACVIVTRNDGGVIGA